MKSSNWDVTKVNNSYTSIQDLFPHSPSCRRLKIIATNLILGDVSISYYRKRKREDTVSLRNNLS